jgi:cytosine/adenosine deaminase-related metal-dependent hydrolase
MDLLIRGGTVVTQNPGREVLDADLLVRERRIARIARRIQPQTPARVIDARGGFVIPGLVQTHVHLCQTLFRGLADDLSLMGWLRRRIWPLEAAHDGKSVRASARLGIAELLRSGTTCIQDMGTVHHTEEIFRALEEEGLRAFAGKAMMDRRHGLPRGLWEAEGGGDPTQASLRESAALCDAWHGQGGGRLGYAFAPRFALSCTEGLLREVSQEARRRGARLHTHAAESRDEVAQVREETGQGNVAYLHRVGMTGPDAGLAHCIWLDPDEEGLLARTGTHVLHCPSSNLKLGSGIAPVPELIAKGVSVSLGADGAPCNNNLDAFLEMRLAALVQKGRVGPEALPAKEVFDLCTLGGARALGLEAEVGSLEVGKRADLAVLDLGGAHTAPGGDLYSRIVYAARATDVTHVVVDGAVLVEDRRLVRMDEAEVAAVARAELKKLLRRVEA